MSLTPALAPLVGFFLALVSFWCWSQSKEAAVSAELQKRLWDHSKYQRAYDQASPLENSEDFRRQQRLYLLGCGVCAVLSAACFVVTFFMLSK